MRRREGTGEVELHSRATRIVPAAAPGSGCEPAPGAGPSAPRRTGSPQHEGAHGARPAATPTPLPRTLGDTAAHAAIVIADPRSRHTTAARRLRPGDTALVTATTQLLAVIEPEADAEQRALVPVDPELQQVVALGLDMGIERDREPVTIVAATLPPARSALVRLGAPPRHPSPRARRARMAVVSIMLAVCMLGAVRFALPLTRDRSQPAGHTAHLPNIGSREAPVPTGPWSTGSGVADTLGLGGGAGPGVKAPGSAGAPVSQSQQSGAKQPTNTPASAPSGSSGVLPAPLYPWPPSNPFMYVPGHPAFGMSDVNGYYYWAFGQCTWWAQYKKQNENLTHMGSAMYWASGAAARGYRTGSSPAAGATVVFQPGVQGAGGYGHVAHVEAVYPGGWFLVSEMNFYVNGGGWGRVDYRYAHAGWGVSFIY